MKCRKCSTREPSPGMKMCQICREKRKTEYAKAVANGMCGMCGTRKASKGKKTCNRCRTRDNEKRMRAYYERKRQREGG